MNLRPTRQHRNDDGTALVEFTFVAVLLFTLILGIITFGYLLSFKQNVTQAAAEGARVGAIESIDPPEAAAQAAVDEATGSFDQSCGAAMTCDIDIHDCGSDTSIDTAATPDCITVAIDYDYANNPILPDFPLISALLPDNITASSTAQVNP